MWWVSRESYTPFYAGRGSGMKFGVMCCGVV